MASKEYDPLPPELSMFAGLEIDTSVLPPDPTVEKFMRDLGIRDTLGSTVNPFTQEPEDVRIIPSSEVNRTVWIAEGNSEKALNPLNDKEFISYVSHQEAEYVHETLQGYQKTLRTLTGLTREPNTSETGIFPLDEQRYSWTVHSSPNHMIIHLKIISVLSDKDDERMNVLVSRGGLDPIVGYGYTDTWDVGTIEGESRKSSKDPIYGEVAKQRIHDVFTKLQTYLPTS